jgi:hypothetical protein
VVAHPAEKKAETLRKPRLEATRISSRRRERIDRAIAAFFSSIAFKIENGIIREGDPEWRIGRVLEELDEESRIEKFEQASGISRYIRDRLEGKTPAFLGNDDLELAELILSDIQRSDWLFAHYGALRELKRRYETFAFGNKVSRTLDDSFSDRTTASLLEEIFDGSSSKFAAFVNKEFVANQFIDSPPLPHEAPALWKSDRQKDETPPAFIKRVYGEWERKGLTKNLIRKLDPPLYRALYNWTARGNEMPADLDLPSLQEQNDRTVADIVLRVDSPAMAVVREGRRIESALRRRLQEK